ncbi:hypothetical protein [Amycolatopsis thermoflava]|uniref:hypothetical protein n=1 Tax=Amycolatopsis thermoflava TaxID=84480 RepID=UPI000F4C2211|nr:hypothetical protein [Amycolatopsis thermoflava]
MTDRNATYADGAFQPGGPHTIPVENLATTRVIGVVPDGTATDTARAAFPSWSSTSARPGRAAADVGVVVALPHVRRAGTGLHAGAAPLFAPLTQPGAGGYLALAGRSAGER